MDPGPEANCADRSVGMKRWQRNRGHRGKPCSNDQLGPHGDDDDVVGDAWPGRGLPTGKFSRCPCSVRVEIEDVLLGLDPVFHLRSLCRKSRVDCFRRELARHLSLSSCFCDCKSARVSALFFEANQDFFVTSSLLLFCNLD